MGALLAGGAALIGAGSKLFGGSSSGSGQSGNIQNVNLPQYGSTIPGVQADYITGTEGLPGQNIPGYTIPQGRQTTQNLYNNPYAAQFLGGSGTAYELGLPAASNAYDYGAGLAGYGNTVAGYGANTAGLAGATAGLGSTTAGLGAGAAGLANPLLGYAGVTGGYGAQAAGTAPTLYGAGNQAFAQAPGAFQNANTLMNLGLDPQSALYNRTLGQVTNQEGAQLANSGIANTPYGQGVMGNTISNFNIDWQNQQLARAAQGAQAYSGLQSTGQNALGLGGNLYGAGTGALTAGGNLNTAAGNLIQGAGGQLSNAAGIYGTAGNLYGGAGNLYGGAGNLYTGAGNLVQGGSNMQLGAAQDYANFAGLPYNTFQGIGGQQMTNLSNLQGLTQGGIGINQAPLNNWANYLQLGNQASAPALNQSIAANNANTQAGNQFGAGLATFGNSPFGQNLFSTSGGFSGGAPIQFNQGNIGPGFSIPGAF